MEGSNVWSINPIQGQLQDFHGGAVQHISAVGKNGMEKSKNKMSVCVWGGGLMGCSLYPPGSATAIEEILDCIQPS